MLHLVLVKARPSESVQLVDAQAFDGSHSVCRVAHLDEPCAPAGDIGISNLTAFIFIQQTLE